METAYSGIYRMGDRIYEEMETIVGIAAFSYNNDRIDGNDIIRRHQKED